MILHLLMLLLLAYILLLPYCQSQRYYCTIHSLIVIGWSLLLTATTMHTAPTELIQEKRQHQCHYQDQYDTSGAPKVEGNNGLTIGF